MLRMLVLCIFRYYKFTYRTYRQWDLKTFSRQAEPQYRRLGFRRGRMFLRQRPLFLRIPYPLCLWAVRPLFEHKRGRCHHHHHEPLTNCISTKSVLTMWRKLKMLIFARMKLCNVKTSLYLSFTGYGEVGSLQSLACLAIENLVRKSLDQVTNIIIIMLHRRFADHYY